MSIKVLDKGEVALIDHMGSDQRVIESARVSYQKGTKQTSDDRTLIRYMARHRHTSVFEQVVFTFYMKAPLFVLRQFFRHRTLSANEESARYSEMKDEWYIPTLDRLQKQSKSNKQGSEEELELEVQQSILSTMIDECESAYENYQMYLEQGLSREVARINLPLSMYSSLYFTINLHNLFHFIKLRSDSHAQWELQEYARAIYSLIQPIVPIACEAFQDYVLESIFFSKQELEALSNLISLRSESDLELQVKALSLSKREQKEFIQKVNTVCQLAKKT